MKNDKNLSNIYEDMHNLFKDLSDPLDKEEPKTEFIPHRFRELGEISFIDRGTVGSVHKISGKNEYAIKIIQCGTDPVKYQNALHELHIMKKLKGQTQAIQLCDYEITESAGQKTVYILEEYHTTMKDFLRDKVLYASDAFRLIIGICEALTAVEKAGIFYLDVQPKNIFVDDSDSVKLGDFSFSLFNEELSSNHTMRGTLAYMAPEVYRNGEVSEQSDIYSVGLMLFALFNNRILPFMDTDSKNTAIYRRLAGTKFPPVSYADPEIAQDLNRIIGKACAYNTCDRYKNISSFKDELLYLLNKTSASAYSNVNIFSDSGEKFYDADSIATSVALSTPSQTIQADDDNNPNDLPIEEEDLSEAREYYTVNLETARQLAQEIHTVEARRDRAVSLEKMGDIEKAEGNLSKAREYYTESLEIRRQIVEETHTVQARGYLAVSLERLGDIEKTAGNLFEARECYGEILKIRQQLMIEKCKGKAPMDLSIDFDKLGNLIEAEGNLPKVREYAYTRYLAIMRQQTEKECAAEATGNLSTNFDKLGDREKEDDDNFNTENWDSTVPVSPGIEEISDPSSDEDQNGNSPLHVPEGCLGADKIPHTVYCKVCGSTLISNARFCPHCGCPVAPEGSDIQLQKVQFSAVAPKTLSKGCYSIINVIMYEESCRHIVDDLISAIDEDVQETKSGMQKVREGSGVTIILDSPDIAIEDNTETGIWQGEYLNFSFAIFLPVNYEKKQIMFTASVYINNLIASKLKFIADCTASSDRKITVSRKDISSAFVSYAHKDRRSVAAIIMGMKKARPDLDLFFDIENIRSGAKWKPELRIEIEQRDLLFLCWSHFAKKSKWVNKEWRYALEHKGIDFIEPVPLESPEVCPPPEELAEKHFNDKLLFIINSKDKF